MNPEKEYVGVVIRDHENKIWRELSFALIQKKTVILRHPMKEEEPVEMRCAGCGSVMYKNPFSGLLIPCQTPRCVNDRQEVNMARIIALLESIDNRLKSVMR